MLENLLKNKINQLMPSNLDNNWYNCPRTLRVLGAIYQLFSSFEGINSYLGAVHMSRASPANRADLSHENLYFSTT